MKGTKIIHYATPKQVQLRLKSHQPFRASKKPSKYCIKIKSLHQFSLIKKEKSIIFDQWFITQKCKFCGKKKITACLV